MTIQFACACGQQLAAREEFAGKRVRCTSCGEVRIVPARGADRSPTRAPAAPELIRFHCSCGQICQARPEHAGRNTRCPRCSTVLTIPAGAITGEAPAPRRSAALQADEPVRRPVSRREVDEDEEFEDNRPRRRRRRAKKSKLWIWIAAAAGVLLIGGGLALWLLLRGGTSSDFDLVPRDAQGFITVRVADLVDSPLGKQFMDRMGGRLKEVEKWEDKLGLSRKDIERVTWVFIDAEKNAGWLIVKTNKAYDKDKIMSSLKEGDLKEQQANGKTYYLDSGGPGALCFHSDRMFLIASSGDTMETCLALPKKPKSGPLDEALQMASKGKNQYAAGINVPSDKIEPLRKNIFVAATPLKVFLDAKTAYMTMACKNDIDWEIGVTFADKGKAKEAEKAVNDSLSQFKAQGNIPGAKKQLDTLKPRLSGTSLYFSGTLKVSDFLEGLDMALKMQGFDRFFR
ncbi:MAG: hypothetical protein HYS12_24045 [Planctomycetes bacterium]|nr:hypothetical protein [Planctomycetota bacterium]